MNEQRKRFTERRVNRTTRREEAYDTQSGMWVPIYLMNSTQAAEASATPCQVDHSPGTPHTYHSTPSSHSSYDSGSSYSGGGDSGGGGGGDCGGG